MRKFLYHDYIVKCDLCNFKCDYCLSSNEGKRLGEYGSSDGVRILDVPKTLHTLLALYNEIPAPILKISGGELFMFPNMDELLAELAKIYDHIQILTNGVLLNQKTVDMLSRYKNISYNLSLDGHTLQMNYARFQSEALNQKLLSVLDMILEKVGHIEITSVITDRNVKGYESFLEYLEGLSGNITAFPIPVRGAEVQKFLSMKNRWIFAQELVGIIERHRNVTGPMIYYERLAKFLQGEKILRKDRCFIPKLSVQLFDTGVLIPCPLGWTISLGNIHDSDHDKLIENIESNSIYNILTHKRHKLDICKDCFAQTDLINLYLNNMLPLHELIKVPLFSSEKVIETLNAIYEEMER